jgi:hypothetical protein
MRPAAVALLVVCCVLAALPPAPPSAGADEAVAALAKYSKPIEESVNRALAYLAKQQHAEGYWPSRLGKNTAVTSLAVMAFLAKGYTPGTGPYGEVINKGIDFVLRAQKPNGLLFVTGSHGPMYSHTISTLMLSEVSGMVDAERQKLIDKGLPHAVRLILSAQKVKKSQPHQGGWRYQPTSRDADISCTGWALMSLRSARNNGAPIPKKAIDDAVAFVLNCRDVSGGAREPGKGVGFCYQPGSSAPGLARTGTAVLCLELCGKHRCKEALGGGDWILAHPAKKYGASFFYYGLYYCAQAMFQLGGKYWERFAPHMYEMMLKFQRKDGSWPQGAANEASAGTCYSTAMGVLAIAVSYRQLPIYQR